MKKKLSVLATFAVLLLASCSKEKSIDSLDPNAPQLPGNTNAGNLLVRIVMETGTDSTVNLYGYDNQNRLNRISIVSSDPNFITEEYKLIRNSNGQIAKTVFRSSEFALFGVDSVVYDMFYNAGKNQYTHKILAYELPGGTYKDSTAYTYNVQNQIAKEESFVFNPAGNTYFPSKTEYVYAGGNLSKMLIYYYDDDTDEYILFNDDSYEYDNKTNPLSLGNEAIVIMQHGNFNINNPVKQTSVFPDEPAYNFTVVAAYTYNNKNKPEQASVTDQATGSTSTIRFYYQ